MVESRGTQVVRRKRVDLKSSFLVSVAGGRKEPTESGRSSIAPARRRSLFFWLERNPDTVPESATAEEVRKRGHTGAGEGSTELRSKIAA